MSYLEYFSLEREPFSNAPDARFYYDSNQHSQALIRLMYAVNSNKGLAVLVGGVGTGGQGCDLVSRSAERAA